MRIGDKNPWVARNSGDGKMKWFLARLGGSGATELSVDGRLCRWASREAAEIAAAEINGCTPGEAEVAHSERSFCDHMRHLNSYLLAHEGVTIAYLGINRMQVGDGPLAGAPIGAMMAHILASRLTSSTPWTIIHLRRQPGPPKAVEVGVMEGVRKLAALLGLNIETKIMTKDELGVQRIYTLSDGGFGEVIEFV